MVSIGFPTEPTVDTIPDGKFNLNVVKVLIIYM